MTVMEVRTSLLAAAQVTFRPNEEKPLSVPGFIESHFSPLVKTVIDKCLRGAAPDGLGASGARTALLLVTAFGDATTTELASRRLVEGRPHNPLLFYQSVPTSILGFVTRDHGITGPITCLSLWDAEAAVDAVETAGLMLTEDDVDQLLLVGVELAPSPRTTAVRRQLKAGAEASGDRSPSDGDAAVAVLLRRSEAGDRAPVSVALRPRAHGTDTETPLARPPAYDLGHLHGLGALWTAAEQLRGDRTLQSLRCALYPGGPELLLHSTGA